MSTDPFVKKCCETCTFWEAPDDEYSYGRCRRYPPKVNEKTQYTLLYPVTPRGNLCGEYKSEIELFQE